MSRERGRKYDGISRPSDDTYRQRWNEIFGKKEKPKKEKKKNKKNNEEDWSGIV
jgi:hypothetical protein